MAGLLHGYDLISNGIYIEMITKLLLDRTTIVMISRKVGLPLYMKSISIN